MGKSPPSFQPAAFLTFHDLIICILQDVGIEVDVLDPELVDVVRGILTQGLDEGDGIVGFGTFPVSCLDYTS